MDFKLNQKHPDWLTVLVSSVISEWLCHLQWTWTSYWWVLDGNLFERHQLLRDLRHTHILYMQTRPDYRREGEKIQTHNCQWWTGWCREFLKWQKGPGFRSGPLLIVLCCTLLWPSLDVHWEITIFIVWVFLHYVCLDVWIVWLSQLKGLIAGIITKAAICSNKHTASQAKRKCTKPFPPFVYMPTC